MDTVEIIQIIKTTLLRRGEGISDDPIRIITQYWDMDGNLLFELDNHLGKIQNNNVTLLS